MRLTSDEIEHIQRTGTYENGMRTIRMDYFKALCDTAASKVEQPPARPPIERYVRCSVTRGAWTVEPGIEWREGDNWDAITGDLEVLACGIASAASTHDEPMRAVIRGEEAFTIRWPDRAFFIEVHAADGRWTQTYQPYGIPRNP